MKTITLSSKNQIVIPTAVRAKLGIRSGDKLVIEKVTDDYVMLKKEPSYKDLVGILPKQKEDPVKRIRKLRDNWR